MRQAPDESTQHLAERLCWGVAHRDDTRVARRLSRQQEVEGVYRLDDGAVLADFFHFLQAVGVGARLEDVRGVAIQRAMGPYVQDCLALRAADAVRHGPHECPASPVVQR
jgi:hypothetical protein